MDRADLFFNVTVFMSVLHLGEQVFSLPSKRHLKNGEKQRLVIVFPFMEELESHPELSQLTLAIKLIFDGSLLSLLLNAQRDWLLAGRCDNELSGDQAIPTAVDVLTNLGHWDGHCLTKRLIDEKALF